MVSFPVTYPFYRWVPKWLGILILLMFFLPILTVGGTYSATSLEMMSGLGLTSDHIQFVNFATSIGMAAFCPFLYRLVLVRREKMMCIGGFSVMFILSYICAVTESIYLLALCNIIMGFLRMVLMMVNLFTLIRYAGKIEASDKITPGTEPATDAGWDALDAERSLAQPAIYLFFMILGQCGTWLTAWLAYEYEWQYVYYFMMGLLLICIMLCFITMPYFRYPTHYAPLNLRHFGNVTLFCLSLISLVYVLTYGKVLDWYDDPTIGWATVSSILFAIAFVYMERQQKRPYYMLDVLKLRTIRMGVIFYFLLMVLNSSSVFVNVFTGLGMKIDNWQNATLGNWSMLGYTIGGFIVMGLSSKKVHFKWLFATGFLFIGIAALFMYFEVQTAGLYERMKYPVILRCIGMMCLYSLIPTYATQRMPHRFLSSWICTMITVRMVIAPCVGTALYSNVLQERQQHYVTRYAQNVDTMNPDANAAFSRTLQGMQYQGRSRQEAEQMASISTKGGIQVQATLSSIKEMAGWTFYACMACMTFTLLVRYPKRKFVP